MKRIALLALALLAACSDVPDGDVCSDVPVVAGTSNCGTPLYFPDAATPPIDFRLH